VYDLKEQRLLRISGLNDPLAYDEFPALATP
jgi:hypothetical protein